MRFVDFPHEDTFDYGQERTCKNCQQIFHGRYCHRCGEKVIIPEDRSLVVLFKKTFRTIPILDNKFMRTLRLMLTRTGFVSRNFIDGLRIPFVDPLTIFLVINLLYYLFPTFQTYNSPLRNQMHFLLHSEVASEMVTERLAKENISLPDFTVRYEHHAANVAKVMLVGFVLLLALPFWIINYSSGFFFRDHLIVSMEFCSVSILLNNLAIPWLWYLIGGLFTQQTTSPGATNESFLQITLMVLVCFALFYLIEKRVYGLSRRRSAFVAMMLIAGGFVTLHLYFGLVFFISMWTL